MHLTTSCQSVDPLPGKGGEIIMSNDNAAPARLLDSYK
jgi:hypothetical protein